MVIKYSGKIKKWRKLRGIHVITKVKGNNKFASHIVRNAITAKKHAKEFNRNFNINTWVVPERKLPSYIRSEKHLDKLAIFKLKKRKFKE